jgi:hypothetical protein
MILNIEPFTARYLQMRIDQFIATRVISIENVYNYSAAVSFCCKIAICIKR